MPALLPLAAIFALYFAYGVPLGTACLYVGYEAAYIVLPGWLLYRALAPAPGSKLRQLVLGLALGYVVEIACFILTGVTDTRGQLFLYPLVVAALTVPVVLRRRSAALHPEPESELDDEPGERRPGGASPADWVTGAVCALAVAYAGVAVFGSLPYPGQEAVYLPDYVYHLSLAGEAKHHWPITEPAAAGEPKPYHLFAHMHMASASTVSGIDLPIVVFRLYLLPLIALVAASVALLGRSLSRRAWVGAIAVVLALLLGEIDPDKQTFVVSQIPFFGLSFDDLILSPSFLVSEALLIPLVLVLYELLARDGAGRARAGGWAVAALLAFGCAGAKVSALPVVLAALAVVGVWEAVRLREPPRNALAALGMLVAVVGGFYLVQYRGADTPSDLALHPFGFIGEGMPAVQLLSDYAAGLVGGFPLKSTLLDIGGAVLGAAGLLAAVLAGLYWLFRIQGRRLTLAQGWLLALFGAGLVISDMVLGKGSPNGTYFLNHAWPMGAVLAAEGLWLAWTRYGEELRQPPRRGIALALAAIWAACFGLLVAAPTWFDPFSGPQAQVHTYLFWYGGLLAGLIALYAAARLLIGRGGAPALLVTVSVLFATAVGAPLDYGLPQLEGRQNTDLRAIAKRITPPIYDGLRWIRGNTDSDAVLAVNNQWIDLGNVQPGWTDYSAFAERRVFLEGWYYTPRALEGGKTYADVQSGRANPYAERLALSEAAFRGECAALSELAARGVDYLVVDKINGAVIPPPGSLDEVSGSVYENTDIGVLELNRERLAGAASCKAALASGATP